MTRLISPRQAGELCAAVLLVWAVLQLVATRWGRKSRYGAPSSVPASPARVLVVFGSGGHTAEMLALLRSLPRERYQPCGYVVADTDTTSEPRAKASGVGTSTVAAFHSIPRSREVGQSRIIAVAKTLFALGRCFTLLRRLQPDLLLTNGPGTCLPMCIVALGLRCLGWQRTRVVFVESVCRVTTMSLTGRLLYPVADAVMVQWEGLRERYPRAVYIGRQL